MSFVQYSDIRKANLNMNILQTAEIEEVVSPLMVVNFKSNWLVIEKINYTLHDYMK